MIQISLRQVIIADVSERGRAHEEKGKTISFQLHDDYHLPCHIFLSPADELNYFYDDIGRLTRVVKGSSGGYISVR